MGLEKHRGNQYIVREIYNLIPVIEMFRQDRLVIFGIDDVLLMASEEDDLRHPYRTKLWQYIIKRLTPKKIEFLESSIISSSKKILVDPRIIDIFEHLKSQQIPTIALTDIGAGDFGIIKKIQDFKIEELNKVGISFKNLTPLHGEYIIPELKNTNTISKNLIKGDGLPMLKSGVVLTAGIDRGLVLEYMFRKHNYHPKSIIFVDNCINNFESFKKLCIKFKMDFYGFCYKAVSLMPFPIINEELEKWRFDILEQECIWLNYKKLKKEYLDHNNCHFPKINQFLSWMATCIEETKIGGRKHT